MTLDFTLFLPCQILSLFIDFAIVSNWLLSLELVWLIPSQNSPFFPFLHCVKSLDQWAWNLLDWYPSRILLLFTIFTWCEITVWLSLEFISLIPGQSSPFFQFKHCVKFFNRWAWNLFDLYIVIILSLFLMHTFLRKFLIGKLGILLIDTNSRSTVLFWILTFCEIIGPVSLEFVWLNWYPSQNPHFSRFWHCLKLFDWWPRN